MPSPAPVLLSLLLALQASPPQPVDPDPDLPPLSDRARFPSDAPAREQVSRHRRHIRWYSIREGIRRLLVTDEAGVERVYPICEPATHYYRVITRSNWMPVL